MDESIIKHLEQKQTLKLSDAARLGAKMHPQLIGHTAYQRDGCTCFFGAAAYGLGFNGDGLLYIFLRKRGYDTGSLSEEYAKRFHECLHDQIYKGERTREQIADNFELMGY